MNINKTIKYIANNDILHCIDILYRNVCSKTASKRREKKRTTVWDSASLN